MEIVLAFWSLRNKQVAVPQDIDTEERIGNPSASDPITADHWIVRTVEALSSSGYSVDGLNAMRQTAVYACVRVLAETIASLPLYIYERGADDTKEPARDHPLWPILHDAPNNFQTAFEFFEMSVGHQCIVGNQFSFIERARGDNRILRLVPIHPKRVELKVEDPQRQIVRYIVTDDQGKQESFNQEEIWHLKGLSSDGFIGISPIEMARNTIRLAAIAEDHGLSYFANGLRPSGFLEYPGKLNPTAKENIKESIGALFGGKNKFSAGVLEQGMSWNSVSLSNEDSQYLETRNFQIEEIARLFRVPSILIGHPDKTSTYASAEQFMLSFVVHTIRPWLVRIEQSINRYLLSESDRENYFAKFKVEGLLRGDTKSRYEAYASAITARWMSPNEVRALEDMNPREGGDEFANPAIDTNKKKPQAEQDKEGGADNEPNQGDEDVPA